MTRRSQFLTGLAVAAFLGLPAIAMAAQHDHTRATPPPQVQTARPDVAGQVVMTRMKALDERIKTLTTDMNMFIGDMKVQAMASLLSAMVERDTLMRDEMMKMHDGMMKMSCAPETAGSR
jgi:hypothetical protein